MRYLKLLLALLVVTIFGCGSAQLKPVGYEKTIAVKTNRSVSVPLLTGIIEGGTAEMLVPAGNIFIPITSGASPELRFNEKDQEVFAQSLIGELNRLEIAKAEKFEKPRPVNIKLIFAQTQHSGSTHRYILDVVMIIESQKNKKITQKYEVDSEEGVGFFTKMNTNAADGKERAAKMLLDRVLPDTATFLSRS